MRIDDVKEAIQTGDPFFMDTGAGYHYSMHEQNDIALTDTGATRNYISHGYAKRLGLRIQEIPSSTKVRRGHRIQGFGTTMFEMEMSEWKGMMKVTVIEMKADFDVVLGMEWFRE